MLIILLDTTVTVASCVDPWVFEWLALELIGHCTLSRAAPALAGHLCTYGTVPYSTLCFPDLVVSCSRIHPIYKHLIRNLVAGRTRNADAFPLLPAPP